MALIQNKLIVWDWNGTLVDDSFIFVDIMNSFLSSYSLKTISLKNYRDHFCFPVKEYYSSLGFQLTEEEFKTLSISFIKQYKKKMFKPLYTVGQWFQSAGKWIKDVGSKFSTFFGNVFPKTSKFAGLLKGVGKLFGKLVTPVVFFWQGLKKMGEHLHLHCFFLKSRVFFP